MIEVDWTWLAQINLFQIAVVIVALFVIARLLIRFWPWLKKVIVLFDALGQLPAFIARTDAAIMTIKHEVEYNNGSSVKDGVQRVEDKLGQVQVTLEAADAALRKDIEDTRPATPKPATRPRKPTKSKEH